MNRHSIALAFGVSAGSLLATAVAHSAPTTSSSAWIEAPQTTGLVVWATLEATPNPVHLLYGAQSGTFDLEWSGESYADSHLALLIQRTGQAPDPPIDVADDGALSNVPIGPLETVVVQITGDGAILDEVEVTTVAVVPPLDCALVVCGSDLDEVVYPDWVDISLHVAEVRSVTVVVSRVSDRRVTTSVALEITDGVATIRLTGLAPGTAYGTQYVVVDDFGRSTTELVGGFTTAHNR